MIEFLMNPAQQVANSSLAGIIGAVAGVFTSLAILIGSITLIIPLLRSAKKANNKIDQVHTIVNQQRTDMTRYQAALVKALKTAGVDVPDDQSLDN